MESLVEQILKDALDSAEDHCRWMGEALERLRKDGGDPRKIERYERWIAEQTETSIQIRELLARESQPEGEMK